jgi:hypothetical protein
MHRLISLFATIGLLGMTAHLASMIMHSRHLPPYEQSAAVVSTPR